MADYGEEISSNLERAATNLQVAKELFDKGYYDVCASRAYYAAFYGASALLLKEGVDTSKHSGVIALIHQHFVKSGKLSKEQGRLYYLTLHKHSLLSGSGRESNP